MDESQARRGLARVRPNAGNVLSGRGARFAADAAIQSGFADSPGAHDLAGLVPVAEVGSNRFDCLHRLAVGRVAGDAGVSSVDKIFVAAAFVALGVGSVFSVTVIRVADGAATFCFDIRARAETA
jgi:hypothetical protein